MKHSMFIQRKVCTILDIQTEIHTQEIESKSIHFVLSIVTNLVSDKPNKRPNRFLDKDEALLESFAKILERRKQKETGTQVENVSNLNATMLANSVREREKLLTDKDKEFHEVLKSTQTIPPQKYPKPLTAAQEYGWFHNEAKSTQSRFYKPKIACEETKYADVLIRSSTIGTVKKESTPGGK